MHPTFSSDASKPIKLWYNNNPHALLPMLKGEYKMCLEAAMAESEKGGKMKTYRTKGYTYICIHKKIKWFEL